ncbi:MAG: hypothetical protein OSJ76_01920 [Alphaproteobacteria bacterium]|nr:hypothetical protein [Alphaproteobacteria bacterium]
MQQRQTQRGNKSGNYTLPSPVGGLNARDSIDKMALSDAIVMDNYIPLDTKVVLRRGYQEYARLNVPVKTLVEYKKPGADRLIAIGGGKAWNLTSKADVTDYDVSFKDNTCQTMQYKDRLFFVNGYDVPKVFYVNENGEDVFEDWGFTHETIVPERMINVSVSKQFLWFVEKDSLKAWYPSVGGNTAGELVYFDLSAVARFGGYLVAVLNWTQDGGQGIDDLTVFLTSEGEALVYAGSNPNNAADWALRGAYKISKPIGWRCAMQYQGDVVIITEDGYIPLAKALPLEKANASQIAFSDKIRGLVLERARSNREKEGWQAVIYGRGGYAIFNVPTANQFEQHVVNLNSGAWCRFTNIRAFCWGMFQGRVFFGSDKAVFLFDEGYSDNGNHILGEVQQAFSSLGTPNLKKIQLLNPRTKSSTQYALVIYTNMDFEERKVGYRENIGSTGMTKWDVAVWSSLANPIGTKWATLRGKIRNQWIANAATGFKASIVFKTKTRGNLIEWYDTGIRYEQGQNII